MMNIEDKKRKIMERITYDEIAMIDQNTNRVNKKRKKELGKEKENEKHLSQDIQGEEEKELLMTPTLCVRVSTFESPLIMSFCLPHQLPNEEEEEEEEEEEKEDEENEKGKQREKGQEGKGGKEEKAEKNEILWPITTKEWWIQFVLLSKFQERLSWGWKQLTKGFKGSLLMPVEVFLFFFGSFEKTETENKVKLVIKTKQNLKQLDKILLTSDWRKMKFYHQDSVGAHFQGTCKVVLMVEKKVEWAGGAFIDCPCDMVFSYTKKTSLFSFSGVLEGRNKVKAFRF
jgi:hypothetical protein